MDMAADVDKTKDLNKQGGLQEDKTSVESHEISEVDRLKVELDVMHDENLELKESLDKNKALLIAGSEISECLDAAKERNTFLENEYNANLQYINEKLEKIQKFLRERDQEIKLLKNSMANKNGRSKDEVAKLKGLSGSTKTENQVLVEKVTDLKTIAEKTDNVCQIQKELLEAKDEIIGNLKKELESLKLEEKELKRINEIDELEKK